MRALAQSSEEPKTPSRGLKRFFFSILVVCFSLLFSLLLGEGALRLLGRKPWTYSDRDLREPTLHDPDLALGWKNKPGVYDLPPYRPGDRDSRVTFLNDGSRATGIANLVGQDKVTVVGCSVTEGWGLSDEQTYPWKLQDKFPTVKIINYGTAAYGTLQSLLRLERMFSEFQHPKMVLYGFITQHESRNVAMYNWMRGLAQYSKRGHVAVPFVTIDEKGELQRHPPEKYPIWPLSERLATVSAVRDLYMRLMTRRRAFQARTATQKLILEMNELCHSNDTRFAVAILLAEDAEKSEYARFLGDHDVPFIDCAFPLTPEMQVPGEGHPNGAMNTLWANCIAEKIGAQLSSAK